VMTTLFCITFYLALQSQARLIGRNHRQTSPRSAP
jgi:hypothetical protein